MIQKCKQNYNFNLIIDFLLPWNLNLRKQNQLYSIIIIIIIIKLTCSNEFIIHVIILDFDHRPCLCKMAIAKKITNQMESPNSRWQFF